MHSHPTTPYHFPHCPTPPDWTLDWQALLHHYAWLRTLDGVPQNPRYHAEGDVLTHTRLVVEALIRLNAWRNLPEQARSLLFAAALLHDLGRATTTHTDPDGRITLPKHAQVGAQMARAILSTGDHLATPVPFPERETIVQLVRCHGLPVWAFERADPQREVIAVSQTVRLDWLALLAEADVRGRIATDSSDLLTTIALFRELAAEEGCSMQPYAFANDHSRVPYFRTPGRDPAYAAYDDTTFEVVVMSGLPGAGKDTWLATHLADWPVIALDDLRPVLDVDPAETQGTVVQAAKACARAYLRQRHPFTWNATTITASLRRQLIDLFVAYGARVRLIYVEAPYADLLARNRHRAAAVPEPVIHRLLRRLDVPDLTEAHRVVWVVEDSTR